MRQLSADLTGRFGRGFSRPNLQRFREFYLRFPLKQIRFPPQLSSNSEAVIRKSQIGVPADAFPLPWSHYVLLIGRARSTEALAFYHTEALGGGWSVRQLDRQIASEFYERTALSRNKAAMLTRGGQAKPGDALTADEQVRDPLILEIEQTRERLESRRSGNTAATKRA